MEENPIDLSAIHPPTATLYRAAISLGAQETQLIWSRYTGFIVINGFLINALTNSQIGSKSELVAGLGIVFLILNCIWHVLNYAGWQNQNLLYRLAANLFPSDIGLLTDYFRVKNHTPVGWIYWLAQIIPTMFSLLALPCLANTIESLFKISKLGSWIATASTWLIFAAAVLLIEYKAIASQVRSGAIEPA